MPFEDAQQPLVDILENIKLARAFVDGVSYADFVTDKRTVYAVTRALEIISEAARRLPEELLERYPHLPWKDIKGAGHVYRHEYEDVLESMLWTTVQQALDPLEIVIRTELKRWSEEADRR